jgi:hypothetical protein
MNLRLKCCSLHAHQLVGLFYFKSWGLDFEDRKEFTQRDEMIIALLLLASASITGHFYTGSICETIKPGQCISCNLLGFETYSMLSCPSSVKVVNGISNCNWTTFTGVNCGGSTVNLDGFPVSDVKGCISTIPCSLTLTQSAGLSGGALAGIVIVLLLVVVAVGVLAAWKMGYLDRVKGYVGIGGSA